MKIVVVMAFASPWSRELARALQEAGHDVHAVDFAEPPSAAAYISEGDPGQEAAIAQLATDGVTLHRIASAFRSALRYLTGARRLARIARSIDADVVLTLYGGGFAVLALASRVRPYAVYAVGSDVLLARGLDRQLARVTLERAVRVFANGAYLAARTQALAPRADVRLLYMGIDTTAFRPVDRDGTPVRAVCTRGFLSVYNNAYIIDGLAARGSARPPLGLTFVSKGPLQAAVMAHADRVLSPAQRAAVEFLGGAETARVRAELERAQLYLSTSVSDGTSISLLEALAVGLYPILSDIPQNREWIDERVGNGRLVPLNDPPALAAAIDAAIDDVAGRARAADYNRRIVRERADRSTNIAALAEQLRTAVAATRTT